MIRKAVDLLIAGCMFTAIEMDEYFYYVEDPDFELGGQNIDHFKIWIRGRWVNNTGNRKVKVNRANGLGKTESGR